MNLHNIAGAHYTSTRAVASLAADPTQDVAIGQNPFAEGKGRLDAVEFIPDTALNGADTNSETLNVLSSAGTALGALAFTAGVNAPVRTKTAIPLTGTPAQRTVAAGGFVVVQRAKVGTGLANPSGTFVFTWKPVGG